MKVWNVFRFAITSKNILKIMAADYGYYDRTWDGSRSFLSEEKRIWNLKMHKIKELFLKMKTEASRFFESELKDNSIFLLSLKYLHWIFSAFSLWYPSIFSWLKNIWVKLLKEFYVQRFHEIDKILIQQGTSDVKCSVHVQSSLLGPPTWKTGQTGSKPTEFRSFYPFTFTTSVYNLFLRMC